MTNFYRSKKWRKKREVVLRLHNYLCRECKRYGKTTQANTVHHIHPLEGHPEYRLVTDNLLALCSKCHNKMHDRFTNELTASGTRWKAKTVLPPSNLGILKPLEDRGGGRLSNGASIEESFLRR